jgi:hypothetical protein
LQQKKQQIKTIMERMWAISSVGASLDFDHHPVRWRAAAPSPSPNAVSQCGQGKDLQENQGFSTTTPRLGTAAKGILFFGGDFIMRQHPQ